MLVLINQCSRILIFEPPKRKTVQSLVALNRYFCIKICFNPDELLQINIRESHGERVLSFQVQGAGYKQRRLTLKDYDFCFWFVIYLSHSALLLYFIEYFCPL